MNAVREQPHELRVGIESIAFWAPRLPSWECARAVLRGERLPELESRPRPVPTLLAPTERRRAPDTVAIALEVAANACHAAGRVPSELDSVFASSCGDLAIADYMCSTLAGTPELISPTKFHNSVHNAAAGYWCIGTGTHTAYTALSAHKGTFAAGLLEAAVQVHCGQRPVLFVAYDIEVVGALGGIVESRVLTAIALVLHGDVERTQTSLTLRVDGDRTNQADFDPSPALEVMRGSTLFRAMGLLEAIARDAENRARTVALPLNDFASLRVAL